MRTLAVIVLGILLVAGCSDARPPAPTSTAPAPTAAASTTTSPVGPRVRALVDRAGVRADLRTLMQSDGVCEGDPGAACRAAVALLRSVSQRLGTAVVAAGDPTPDRALTDYVEGMSRTADGIEIFCFGAGGAAPDPTNCRRFGDGITAQAVLITVLEVQ